MLNVTRRVLVVEIDFCIHVPNYPKIFDVNVYVKLNDVNIFDVNVYFKLNDVK